MEEQVVSLACPYRLIKVVLNKQISIRNLKNDKEDNLLFETLFSHRYGTETEQNADPLRQHIRTEIRRGAQEAGGGEDPDNRDRIDRIVDRVERRLFAEVNAIIPFWKRAAKRTVPVAAAAALILASVGIAIHYDMSKPEHVGGITRVPLDDALPGGNRATLRFDDGSTFSLSEERSGIVVADARVTYEDGSPLEDHAPNGAAKSKIQQASLTTPNGGTYQILLPDGTKVWLNAASTLRYPTDFDGPVRHVELTGEAYFDVSHRADQPFRVDVQGTIIEVHGTEFNIQAYSGYASTTLVEGSVTVRSGEKSLALHPGEQSYFDGTRFVVHQAEIPKVVAWKDGKFYFSKDNLVEIMGQLSRWYDLEVVYHGEVSVHTGFSGTISRYVNLSEVLEMLSYVSAAEFSVADNKIHVFFND